MGLNRIVNQLFEGVTFGLKITKHLLVTDGNKNNWSQTSPRSKINSRGENVKKKWSMEIYNDDQPIFTFCGKFFISAL